MSEWGSETLVEKLVEYVHNGGIPLERRLRYMAEACVLGWVPDRTGRNLMFEAARVLGGKPYREEST
jgi:hypothetical protein